MFSYAYMYVVYSIWYRVYVSMVVANNMSRIPRLRGSRLPSFGLAGKLTNRVSEYGLFCELRVLFVCVLTKKSQTPDFWKLPCATRLTTSGLEVLRVDLSVFGSPEPNGCPVSHLQRS